MRATILLLAPLIFLYAYFFGDHPCFTFIAQNGTNSRLSLSFTLRDSELNTLCSSPHLEKAWAILALISKIYRSSAAKRVSRYLKMATCIVKRSAFTHDFRSVILLFPHFPDFHGFFSARTREGLRGGSPRLMFLDHVDFHSVLGLLKGTSHYWHLNVHEWT